MLFWPVLDPHNGGTVKDPPSSSSSTLPPPPPPPAALAAASNLLSIDLNGSMVVLPSEVSPWN
jgi:hypothetical protein